MNTFELADKLCMITGGLCSYGIAIAKLMKKRGASIWIVDVKCEDEALQKMGEEVILFVSSFWPFETLKNVLIFQQVGGYVRYHKADVSVEAEYEGAFQKCLEETGKAPDVLVQAATVNGEKDWDRLYEVNLVSQASIFNPFY